MERTLFPSERVGMNEAVTYSVEVKTADLKGNSSSSNIFVNVIGSKGESKYQKLESSPEQFSRGRTDKFKIKSESDVGDLTKLTVKSDCTGISPNWLPMQFTVTNERTGKTTKFNCGLWFSKTLDDMLYERELLPTIMPPKDILFYRITIKTMNLRGAGKNK